MDLETLKSLLIFAGITALLAASSLWSRRREQSRRAALEKFAASLGLAFHGEVDRAGWKEFAEFPLFTQGGGKTIRNRIQADTDEVSLSLFDYCFTTYSDNSTQTHWQTVACFQSPLLNLPQFELRPQHMLDGLGKLLGFQDIDFASHPRFSKTYLLRGAKELAIRRFFTAPLLSFLENQLLITVEGRSRRLLVYRSGRRVNPLQLRDFMGEAFAVYRRFRDATQAAAAAADASPSST